MVVGAGAAAAQTAGDLGAVAFSASERAAFHVEAAFGAEALVGAMVVSAMSHAAGSPESWPRDAGGFSRRYASSLGANAVDQGVRLAVGGWLGNDPRYRRLGEGGVLRRIGHAAQALVVTRDRSGRAAPAWFRVAGAYGASAISAAWYPESSGLARYVGVQGTMNLGGDLVSHLWEEFRPELSRIVRR